MAFWRKSKTIKPPPQKYFLLIKTIVKIFIFFKNEMGSSCLLNFNRKQKATQCMRNSSRDFVLDIRSKFLRNLCQKCWCKNFIFCCTSQVDMFTFQFIAIWYKLMFNFCCRSCCNFNRLDGFTAFRVFTSEFRLYRRKIHSLWPAKPCAKPHLFRCKVEGFTCDS